MTDKALILCGAAAVSWNPDFAAAARRRGLAVLAVESPDAGFARAALAADGAADGRAWAEPDEVGALFGAVRDWSATYGIAGVAVLREDWVEAGALLADLLGTPSLGLRAARVCRDKALQRFLLPEWSPRYLAAEAGDGVLGSWARFPAVVKPARRTASSGVTAVLDRAQLLSALTLFPAAEPVLVEERMAGPEFSVESLVRDGGIAFAEVTAKRTNEAYSDAFVELAHTVPAALEPPARRALLDANARILRRLDVRYGVIHAEYRLTADGTVRLTEINARCPGGSIPALYRLATGASLEDAVVALALGEEVGFPSARRCARQVYLEHQPGMLVDIVVDGADPVQPVWLAEAGTRPTPEAVDPAQPAALRAVTVIKPRGTLLTALTGNRDRAATFLIDAPSLPELDRLEAALDIRLITAPAAAPGADS
jgi:hypothetical protein